MSECKYEDCLEPAVSEMGPYAKLCEFHVNQRKHDKAKPLAAVEEDAPRSNGLGRHAAGIARVERAAAAVDAATEEFIAALDSLRASVAAHGVSGGG